MTADTEPAAAAAEEEDDEDADEEQDVPDNDQDGDGDEDEDDEVIDERIDNGQSTNVAMTTTTTTTTESVEEVVRGERACFVTVFKSFLFPCDIGDSFVCVCCIRSVFGERRDGPLQGDVVPLVFCP